jgi:hypothetical protein
VDHGVRNVKKIYMDYLPYGFAPEIERTAPLAQVERKLHVRVDKVIRFSHAPIVKFRGAYECEKFALGPEIGYNKIR